MKTIRDCMKRNVVSIRATATVREAAALFVARHIGLLPVVDAQGRVIRALEAAAARAQADQMIRADLIEPPRALGVRVALPAQEIRLDKSV
jgi:CBS domain-containing protein